MWKERWQKNCHDPRGYKFTIIRRCLMSRVGSMGNVFHPRKRRLWLKGSNMQQKKAKHFYSCFLFYERLIFHDGNININSEVKCYPNPFLVPQKVFNGEGYSDEKSFSFKAPLKLRRFMSKMKILHTLLCY